MMLDRRRLLALSAAGAGATLAGVPETEAATARSDAPITLGIDATSLGLRPGLATDQTTVLQSAINRAASMGAPLLIPPGTYRTGFLRLPAGAQLFGVRGATKLRFLAGQSLVFVGAVHHVTLKDLTLEGNLVALPAGRGLVHADGARDFRITDCTITGAGGMAIYLNNVVGEIAGNTITDATEAALHSYDARGLLITRNTVRGAGNNGIMIWRRTKGDDGTLITDNRIENIQNRSGGSGQYGNGVNVFRAGNVIVRGNQFRNCAFTAVRGNSANDIQIVNNSVIEVGEVAFYSEFGFEGAMIANNTVDGAAIGISVANFNEGGRLAVITGNIIRNLKTRRPAGTDPNDGAGIGIYAEADTAISGNLVENAPTAGISLGFGRYLRDVNASGNVIRQAATGITVSVTSGAGSAVVANNLITGSTRGALIGMDHLRIATGDLLVGGLGLYSHISATGNRVS